MLGLVVFDSLSDYLKNSFQDVLRVISPEEFAVISPQQKNNNPQLKFLLKKQTDNIIYQTPFCLQQYPHDRNQQLLLAQKICNYFPQLSINQGLSINISHKNWLEITVTNNFLQQYLNGLLKNLESLNLKPEKEKSGETTPSNNSIAFIYIYIHARSCSLLKSAHEREIIKLNTLDFYDRQQTIIEPENLDFHLLLKTQPYTIVIIKNILILQQHLKQPKLKDKYLLSLIENNFNWLEKQDKDWQNKPSQKQTMFKGHLALILINLRLLQIIIASQSPDKMPISI